jgi:hypothetical protein
MNFAAGLELSVLSNIFDRLAKGSTCKGVATNEDQSASCGILARCPPPEVTQEVGFGAA